MTGNEALEKHKEDCRRCKDKACTHGVDCLQKKDIEVYEELQVYRAIGTIEEFKALKEKSVAKKPKIWANGTKHCPNEDCEEVIYSSDEYCLKCGTKIDWQ